MSNWLSQVVLLLLDRAKFFGWKKLKSFVAFLQQFISLQMLCYHIICHAMLLMTDHRAYAGKCKSKGQKIYFVYSSHVYFGIQK